jgi:phosphoglycolate phosphatase
LLQRTLVLDLDGTLVDTAGDLIATLNFVLASEKLEPALFTEGVTMVGRGARAMLAAALAAQAEDIAPARLDRLTQTFIAHYRTRIAELSRPFPGAIAALDRFAGDGWTLAICTNKLEGLSRLLLRELDLEQRFRVIAGQDTFGVAKPDPLHLARTIAAAGGDLAGAVMVGDTEIDVKAARATGIPVVAVSFGYSAVPAEELGADAVIKAFEELHGVANGLVAKA